MGGWLVIGWLLSAASAGHVGFVEESKDLVYGPDASHRLDLFHGGAEARPLVVFVHGGSWVGGDKDNLAKAPGFVPWFQERGYAVAAPEFRHASVPPGGEVGVDEMLEDVSRSIAWLQDHGDELGVRSDSIVLVGFSSGAHLVSLLSTDGTWLEKAGSSTADLAAVVALDVHAYDVPLALGQMEGSELHRNRPLIQHLFGATEAEQRALSPSSYLATSTVPPTLLVSTGDASRKGSKGRIARETNRLQRDRMLENGHQAEHLHLDSASHSSLVMGFGRQGHATTEAVGSLLESL